jgi:hypothetical protein
MSAPAAPPAPAPKPAAAPEPFPGRDDDGTAKEEASSTGREVQAQPAAPARAERFDKLDAARARSAPAKDAPSGQTLAAPEPADDLRQKQMKLQDAPKTEALEQAPSQSKAAASERAAGGALGNSRTERSTQAGAMAGPTISDAERERPDTWLEAIRRVVAAGDEQQARRELRAFQRRHPGLPVPDDLTRLLE